jgi:S1-C subfamily serine protease
MQTLIKLIICAVLGIAPLCVGSRTFAQTTPKSPTTPQKKGPTAAPAQRATKVTPAPQLVVEPVVAPPQVVTMLHRLSGLKMFRLLVRSSDVRAIAKLDDAFTINGNVHTNVVAGLALDDGETIAAWLPEVDAEIGPPQPPQPEFPEQPVVPIPDTPKAATGFARTPSASPWTETPNVTVMAPGRKRVSARYVGLDGMTGLSVLKITRNTLPNQQKVVYANEDELVEGQRIRLFAPEPVKDEEALSGIVYVRLTEFEGAITRIMRAPSGGIARVEVNSPKLSTANIGGVVINESGETLGIIDAVKGREATILPANLIRSAAKRVLERQTNVPKPWLGIRGEWIGSFATEQLLRKGWQTSIAKSLIDEQSGILLTSVAPGSPAFQAALKPGDVIVKVNEGDIRSADDFSWLLEEAGPGGLLRFTVARPDRVAREAVEVKLSEPPDPFFGVRMPFIPQTFETGKFPQYEFNMHFTSSLTANGLETVVLRPKVAARLGSTGGLLVVSVQPGSAAATSGLKSGDVIEAVDGKQMSSMAQSMKLTNAPGSDYTLDVVRDKQKVVFTLRSKQ